MQRPQFTDSRIRSEAKFNYSFETHSVAASTSTKFHPRGTNNFDTGSGNQAGNPDQTTFLPSLGVRPSLRSSIRRFYFTHVLLKIRNATSGFRHSQRVTPLKDHRPRSPGNPGAQERGVMWVNCAWNVTASRKLCQAPKSLYMGNFYCNLLSAGACYWLWCHLEASLPGNLATGSLLVFTLGNWEENIQQLNYFHIFYIHFY